MLLVKLTTKLATLITNRSAFLNGSLEGATSNKIYFEYGPTINFGRTTIPVTTSMIGDFGINVPGLNPKTTYFYRAASNVNGAIIYGVVMSFSTN